MDNEESGGVASLQHGAKLPEYAVYKVEAMAVQNAAGSLDVLGQVALNEWELLRHNVREFGRKIRQVSSNVSAATIQRLWTKLISALRRHSERIPVQFELDAALILNEMQKTERERPPPRDTLADIRRVLLEDVEEEGVIHAKRAPRWSAMPPRRRKEDCMPSPRSITDNGTSAYQLFNQPIQEDDFDRLSLPSTTFAHSESDRIQSLEAQLSMLNRQLSMLMASGLPGVASQRSSRPTSRSHSRASVPRLQQQQLQQQLTLSAGCNVPMMTACSNGGHISPSPTSDDDGVYMHDDSSECYASPSHTMAQQPQMVERSGRQAMLMMGDAGLTIPLPPPLPSCLLQPTARDATIAAEAAEERTVVANSLLEWSAGEDEAESRCVTPLPLPPSPVSLVQKHTKCAVASQVTSTAATGVPSNRSFLDDIRMGSFVLKRAPEAKSRNVVKSSLSSDTSCEEFDENTMGPLVKPTKKQLLSRKDSLRRISADRSPGGTPQNRYRRRQPSLGKDNGKSLLHVDYLAAALASKFSTIKMNEDDDDQSVTTGEQSWMDE